jgi:2,3-bisphosphoglycerate-independent phosphoglycerate mutase
VFPGAGHRHLLVWRRGEPGVGTVSPYELADKPIAAALPSGPGGSVLAGLMDRARSILTAHPVCRHRLARGERAPNAVWLWGAARQATLPTVRERFGVDGSMLAGVALMNGLGALAGLVRIDAPGTEVADDDCRQRAELGLRALAERDLLIVHVEAPDDGGHLGDPQKKIAAIERLDAHLLGPLLDGLRRSGDEWRLLVMPDHPTPCALRRHTDDPVPFIVYVAGDDRKARVVARRYSEKDAREHGIFVAAAHSILGRLLRR